MIDIIVCVGLLLVIVLCGVLNRLRGTGVIKNFGTLNIANKKIEVKFVGNHLYGIYIALVIGLLSTWYYGLIAGLLYMLGESMGWGKWVGSLCYPESTTSLEARYADYEGVRFPFIHKTANMIVKERENYLAYCNIALGIRGLYWWLPLLMFMAVIGITSYWLAILGSILLGVGFPVACYMASITKFEFTWWKISCVGAWERQEIVYGLMQGIVLWAVVLLG